MIARLPDELVARARERGIVEVALMLGADGRIERLPEAGVPCPGCGGHDRFSVNPLKNIFLCRKSGAGGDAITLVEHVQGASFHEAVEWLTGSRPSPSAASRSQASGALLSSPTRGEEEERYRRKAQERAYRVWQGGYSIDPEKGGRLVGRYLALRGIALPCWPLKTLREADRLPYWHWSKARQEFVVVHSGPAMLAAITGADGRFIGVHRTWLDFARPDGKAEIFDPETGEQLAAKKVEGSQRGGRIVLRDGFSVRALVIGEGIETVLAWSALHAADTYQPMLWAGINLDNIAGKAATTVRHPTATVTDALGRRRAVRVGGPEPDPADSGCLSVPPGLCDRVHLLGDGDSDRFTTGAAMQRAASRIAASGTPAVIEWSPDGQDFNDVLLSSGARAA